MKKNARAEWKELLLSLRNTQNFKNLKELKIEQQEMNGEWIVCKFI